MMIQLRFIRCKLLVNLFFFLSPLVWGVDYDIMLDASGSMRGFKEQRQTWERLLNRLESSARRKYQFGDKNNFRRVNAPLINVIPRDNATYLGEALKDWLVESDRGEVVVIITDNVADIGGDSSQSQQVFYDLLSKQDSPFSHIAIFPITLPFDGRVYSLGTGNAFKLYKGSRALSIYAIARAPYSDEYFDKLRELIQEKLDIKECQSQCIQVKPFESEKVSGLVGDIEINPILTGDANVSFEQQPDGTKHLLVRGLSLDNEIKFSFNVEVQSRSSFELQNVELQAHIQLFKEDNLKHFELTDNFTAEVNPGRATISPDKIQGLSVSFQNEPFSFGDLGFFEKLFFSVQEENLTVHGNLDIEFKASRENMKLSQMIIGSWSYEGDASELGQPKVEVQQKVYKLGVLVESMLPEIYIAQKLYSVPVTLELRYPPYALYFMPFVILVCVLGFLFFGFLFQSKTYSLDDDMGHQQEFSLGFWQSYQPGNELLTFSLTYWGIFFWVSVPRPFRLHSHLVSAGQSIRISNLETDEEYNWQLLRTTTDEEEDKDGDWSSSGGKNLFSKSKGDEDWL